MAKQAYDKGSEKFVPRKSIKLGTPKASGRVRTCEHCNTTSRGEESCPYCGRGF